MSTITDNIDNVNSDSFPIELLGWFSTIGVLVIFLFIITFYKGFSCNVKFHGYSANTPKTVASECSYIDV